MHVVSVNVGARAVIEGHLATTGILKRPIESARIETLGIVGDAVCNKAHHGGPDQAVYAYGTTDYQWWSGELGLELAAGTFGENLTIEGLLSAEWNIGDRFEIGTVVLEISAPRIPCATLGARMSDPGFPLQFRRAERPGLYFRVIAPGIVTAGDSIGVQRFEGETVSVLSVYRHAFMRSAPVESLRELLAAPIDIRSRTKIEAAVRRLESRSQPKH